MTDETDATHAPSLPTQYAPGEVEDRLYRRWIAAGYFEADPKSGKSPFSIVIPPPNVTGALHLGHAFGHTIKDALTRRARMQGREALWLPGMDHAGIATQTQVERHLATTEGKSRHDLSREEFVQRVWDWKNEYGGQILGQMRRLGDSVDWSRERFTMDAGLSRAVGTIFKRLFDDGLIYQAERIINWCPRCQTALSDIEVEHRDDEGELVSIRYGDGDSSIVVATTRAETMLGDTGVAVHPGDERYRHLIGQTIELPLTGRRIPVVADEHVDPEFGSGAVKVTPAHDPNDFEIGQRHDLPAMVIMDERAIITTHGPFEGLDRFEARPAVVAALRQQGRIVDETRPYVHAVGHCSRCDTIVEPRLSQQWFVKVESLATAAGDAVRDGRVRLHPPEMATRYFDWVDNMHDWCISRQLWWGHRIPVWYGPNGEVVCVGPDEEPPTGEGWYQDPDVLDTWFSSALWPFSTLGWPDDTEDLRAFYPTSVMVTGYDILFFWVVRMMMFGLYAMADRGPAESVPFRDVVLHGLVRDKHGKKMSKSRGNAVDPLDWMETYGSDALRFTLARGANPGTDVPIGEDWVQGSRNFCNKVWNATRFALMNGAKVDPALTGGESSGPLPAAERLTTADRWILSRLNRVVADVDAAYEEFHFARVCDILYHFAWDELFDWYVELSKTPLQHGGAEAETTRAVLGHVLDVTLRLLHPVIPFVTEELWLGLTHQESITVAPWPHAENGLAAAEAEDTIGELQTVVTEIRRFRSEQGLKPGQRVPARLHFDRPLLSGFEEHIRNLTRLIEPADGFASSAALDVAGVRVELDLSDAVDFAAERKRLEKDLAEAEKRKTSAESQLANSAFTSKAPETVVENVRARLAESEAEISRISNQLAALPQS
ncbi:valyl-tRNA synthetase [Lipingzhangella halophila]|uniref:Valine--tRNA ligase n=1 Tax=Lipingzhangella halophila TaxID=1783352 RepID=A0A7W7RK06_9ACTN|nr:valine--tRNA ligase [Lipingzhangella halophila]MBB4933350.1 valyl-tRNA synthetase [Lipingzhangella halophila]